jgi:hypothetical protein
MLLDAGQAGQRRVTLVQGFGRGRWVVFFPGGVMARQRATVVGVLLGLLVLVAAGRADEASAVREIEKLGGEIIRDDRVAGKPIVSVDFRYKEVTDAELNGVKGLKTLRTLVLRYSKVTDAGLKGLKGLQNLQTLDLSGATVTDAGNEGINISQEPPNTRTRPHPCHGHRVEGTQGPQRVRATGARSHQSDGKSARSQFEAIVMSNMIDELLRKIKENSPEIDQACLAVGLLLEHHRVRRPLPGDDGGLTTVLGNEIAAIQLTPEEIRHVVDQLVSCVQATEIPHSSVIWALSKCYEPRIVPVLVPVLRRAAVVPDASAVALSALYAIATSGFQDAYREIALSAIQYVADEGIGEVKNEATSYIEHYRDVTRDDANAPNGK